MHHDDHQSASAENVTSVGRWRSGAFTSPIDIASAMASSRQAASSPMRITTVSADDGVSEQRGQLAEAPDRLEQQQQRDADDG